MIQTPPAISCMYIRPPIDQHQRRDAPTIGHGLGLDQMVGVVHLVMPVLGVGAASACVAIRHSPHFPRRSGRGS